MLDLSASLKGLLGGLRLNSFCLNSANPVASSHEDLKHLASAPMSAGVTSRTSTLLGFEHDDNIHKYNFAMMKSDKSQQQQQQPVCSLNSYGYSPYSYQYYVEKHLVDYIVNQQKKPYIVSITGTAEEVKKMLIDIDSLDIRPTAVEVNLSCPNIPGEPPVAYHPIQLHKYLSNIISVPATGLKQQPLPIGLKLPPYFYDDQFVGVTDVINKIHKDSKNKNEVRTIAFVTCINTIGGGLMIDTETEASILYPSPVLRGGIGGQSTKPLALGNVARMRQLLNESIDVIGCGGISTGEDVFHFLLAGASCVEIATQLVYEGKGKGSGAASCYSRIAKELESIMKRKGYTSINQFQGKALKKISKL